MKMCQLANGTIVPCLEVLSTVEKLANLVNELCGNPFYEFSKRLPIIELDKLAKSSDHIIENEKVKNMLIFSGLLNNEGQMSCNTRNIIISGLDYENDRSWFYDPVLRVIGDANHDSTQVGLAHENL